MSSRSEAERAIKRLEVEWQRLVTKQREDEHEAACTVNTPPTFNRYLRVIFTVPNASAKWTHYVDYNPDCPPRTFLKLVMRVIEYWASWQPAEPYCIEGRAFILSLLEAELVKVQSQIGTSSRMYPLQRGSTRTCSVSTLIP